MDTFLVITSGDDFELVTYVPKIPLSPNVEVSSRAIGLHFSLSFYLHPSYMQAEKKISCFLGVFKAA